MIREKKYRVWDREEKIMSEGLPFEWFLTGDPGDMEFPSTGESLPLKDFIFFRDHFEIMDFAGLLDRNGKEIYEGDIVKFHYFYGTLGANLGYEESEHELTGVVEFGMFGWGLKAIKGEHWKGHTRYGDGEGESSLYELCAMNEGAIHEDSFEVVGNVYENSELINPQ